MFFVMMFKIDKQTAKHMKDYQWSDKLTWAF